MRRTITMIVGVALALLVLAAGVAVAQQELTRVNCPDQSPDKRGGECKGTKDRDEIDGTPYDDRIAALGDHDLVDAYEGDDRVEGGPGHDRIFGGHGDDTLYGGEGRDTIRDEDPFGISYDNPCCGPDTDRVSGGADNDFIDVHDGDTDDVVSCGEGRYTVRFDKIGTDSDKLKGCEVRYPNPD
jgi:RTX calcium-binding nonapeptide repeat (4 copies)